MKNKIYSQIFVDQLNKKVNKIWGIENIINPKYPATAKRVKWVKGLLSLKAPIHPINDMILIYPDLDEVPEQTVGGIALPVHLQREPDSGIVIESAYKGYYPGDHIKWREFGGIWVDDLILVDANEIIPALIPYS